MRLYFMEHPAALLPSRTPEHRDIHHLDFRRIGRLLAGYRPALPKEFHLIRDDQTLHDWLGQWGPGHRIALDLETTPEGTLDMVGLAGSAESAALLDLPCPDPDMYGLLPLVLRCATYELLVHYGEGLESRWLHPLFREGAQPLVHDLHKLFHAWDPEYASAGEEGGGSGALAFIQSLYSWRPYHKHWLHECYRKGRLVDPVKKARYCMTDALVTWECFHRLEELCKHDAPAAYEAYCRDAVPLLPIMVGCRDQGWNVDAEVFTARRRALQTTVRASAEACIATYGEGIRPKSKKAKTAISPKALKAVLLTQGLKLPRTAKGNPQFDKKARQRLFPKHPELSLLEGYYSTQDTLSDCYGPGIIWPDGRNHATWSGYLVSWRWRCVQERGGATIYQWPAHERDIFIPDPGHLLVRLDTDMGEYRWFAGECQDEDILHSLAEFDAGRAPKPHVLNAASLFGTTIAEALPWKEEAHPLHCRYIFAKNFLYGGALYTWKGGVIQLEDAAAKAGLKLSRPRLQGLRDRWWGQWKRAPRWREQQVAQARRDRVVHCREWGYLRRLHHPDFENEALNYPMQAGIAGIINKAVRIIYREYRLVPLANMHDGLVYQIPDTPASRDRIRMLQFIMQPTLESLRRMVIPVDVSVGYRWGELKPWVSQ